MPLKVQPSHAVTVLHDADRVRAVCTCQWKSPWITCGPPQPDIPPRTGLTDRAIRCAQWHLQTTAKPAWA